MHVDHKDSPYILVKLTFLCLHIVISLFSLCCFFFSPLCFWPNLMNKSGTQFLFCNQENRPALTDRFFFFRRWLDRPTEFTPCMQINKRSFLVGYWNLILVLGKIRSDERSSARGCKLQIELDHRLL